MTSCQRTELLSSVISGDFVVVQRLLDGATPEDLSDLAMVNGTLEYSALMITADRNDLKVMNLLLQSGAPVNQCNKQGTSALMVASSRGYNSIVQTLLQANADLRAKNKDGETATAIASRLGHPYTTKLLSDHGAKQNSSSSPKSPSPPSPSPVANICATKRVRVSTARAVPSQRYNVISPTLPHINGIYRLSTVLRRSTAVPVTGTFVAPSAAPSAAPTTAANDTSATHVFEREGDGLYVLHTDAKGLWSFWDRSQVNCLARAKKVTDLPDTGCSWSCLVGEKYITCCGMTVKAERASASSQVRMPVTASLATRKLNKALQQKGGKQVHASRPAESTKAIAVTAVCALTQRPEDWVSDEAILASLDCDDDAEAAGTEEATVNAQPTDIAQSPQDAPEDVSAVQEPEIPVVPSRKRTLSDCADSFTTPPTTPRAPLSRANSVSPTVPTHSVPAAPHSPHPQAAIITSSVVSVAANGDDDLLATVSPVSPSPNCAAAAGNKRACVYRWGEWIGGTAAMPARRRVPRDCEVIDLTDD